MNLRHGLHLAYCTNIHRGETWPATLANLERHTLAVKQRVCPQGPYAIGLRLGEQAARELSDPSALRAFQRWLDEHHCYVFTINGFPYGQFHGAPVKERVYTPDWATPERLAYTNRLFDVLAQLLPEGVEGSVSTLPGSFKAFVHGPAHERAMRDNLWRCVEHVARLSQRTRRRLHLGLEPEPLCYVETSEETVGLCEALREEHPQDDRVTEHLGVNYDACHLAVEFEEPQAAVARFVDAGVKISKIHLSAALKVRPSPAMRQVLPTFADEVYLHQVVSRDATGNLTRYADLPLALAQPAHAWETLPEWRIHFHVPLHSRPGGFFNPGSDPGQLDFAGALNQAEFDTTHDHLLGLLEVLGANPGLCAHLEMETYTWEVLPPELRQRNVVDQLVGEYQWTLARLAERGLGQ